MSGWRKTVPREVRFDAAGSAPLAGGAGGDDTVASISPERGAITTRTRFCAALAMHLLSMKGQVCAAHGRSILAGIGDVEPVAKVANAPVPATSPANAGTTRFNVRAML